MAKKSAPNTPNARQRPNGNILTFFRREPKEEESLFLGGGADSSLPSQPDNSDLYGDDDWEDNNNTKRRKISETIDLTERDVNLLTRECTPPPPDNQPVSIAVGAANGSKNDMILKKRLIPFMDDSDSDSEDDDEDTGNSGPTPPILPVNGDIKTEEDLEEVNGVLPSSGDFEGFETLEDFEDEEMEQGEELEERRRVLLELEQDDAIQDDEPAESWNQFTCPICNHTLIGVSEEDMSIHVNSCLDSQDTTPNNPSTDSQDAPKVQATGQRIPRPPRPGQKDPAVNMPSRSNGASSAFSKLMAGYAEDSAWKAAAAAEVKARGKPSYERTCPFYKILPGLSICVDAFRYGAVEGCNAYFLSHFHSDHYIGLTPTWVHGPIYCSKVTANLVKQQLRVDPKWVIPLSFEVETEVPNTNGVKVTMIAANHCPGSSLFLFEKKSSPTKTQRILHCGDFRACRAHLEHPLLRPDIPHISGQTKQQKIDICYLDTTYLNPKYAFPSQDAVITSCAELCVRLNTASPEDVPSLLPQSKESAAMKKFLVKSEFISSKAEKAEKKPGRLLVVIGTYSIGKENICVGIARALKSKIYAPAAKQRICACLEDPELSSLLTSDPREAQVHMTPLFEIRPETLDEYLQSFIATNETYDRSFTHTVGFRPTGWTYRPFETNNQNPETMETSALLVTKAKYDVNDMRPQRGSSPRASCYGVPYSEHSSFRELAAFVCGLRIERVIPTVNVGSAKSRERMRAWVTRWEGERRRNGCFDAENF